MKQKDCRNNKLSSNEKETLVSSFLDIAVGRSIETAQHFLQATNWRIEDALQLYYVGDTTQIATVSSYIPSVGYTPLLSDHNHSELDERLLNVHVGRDDGDDTRPPLPVTRGDVHYDLPMDECVMVQSPIMELDSSVAPPTTFAPMISASSPTATRRKRRTPAEMDAAGPIEIAATSLLFEGQQLCFVCALPTNHKIKLTSAPAQTTTPKKIGTCTKMAVTALSSGGDQLCFTSALPTTKARQQNSAEVNPVVFLFGAASTVAVCAPTTARRKRRTNVEMVAAARSSTAVLLMDGTTPTVTHKRGRVQAECQIPPRVHLPSSNNEAGSSRATISLPMESPYCRQSKRLRDVQQTFPIQVFNHLCKCLPL